MNSIEDMSSPFCGAMIEYISRSCDTTEELVTEGYDIMCVLSGSCSFDYRSILYLRQRDTYLWAWQALNN